MNSVPVLVVSVTLVVPSAVRLPSVPSTFDFKSTLLVPEFQDAVSPELLAGALI